MSYEDLNRRILEYVKIPNITGRAIMLTGEWGSGKSFYIRNILKPFIHGRWYQHNCFYRMLQKLFWKYTQKIKSKSKSEKEPQYKYKCVVISLYGRNNTAELSSVVYSKFGLSNYFHKLPKYLSSIGNLTVTWLFYTIYKDFNCNLYLIVVIWIVMVLALSYFHFKSIEFKNTISIDDLKKISRLKKSLIVLEDVERTKIDMFDLFGWVNSLCDIDGKDGTKILLVVNEEKLKEKLDEKQTKIYEKEKTVMDTIQFQADLIDTVNAIIDKHFSEGNDNLSEFKFDKNDPPSGDFKKLMENATGGRLDLFNYREFILACQKVCEIFKFINDNFNNKENEIDEKIENNDEFKKCIFFSLIVYKQGQFICKLNKIEMSKFQPATTKDPSEWFWQKRTEDQIKDLTYEMLDTNLLHSTNYPLFKFCYDYTKKFNFDKENIQENFK